MFGVGMILARGCASRLLVLSATGNLRAFLTGLVLTVVAQASLTGVLAPLRQWLSSFMLVTAADRDLSLFLPKYGALWIAVATLVLAFFVAWRSRLVVPTILAAIGVGGSVAFGWYYTSALSQWSFEPVAVQSITFTGPSANTLMALMNASEWPQSFGLGLVPGVFVGSFLVSLFEGDLKIRTFDATSGMSRYLVGAVLMGFGGMLAGGCAVGAGLTGGSVMSLTAWLALAAMWAGAGITDRIMDSGKAQPVVDHVRYPQAAAE